MSRCMAFPPPGYVWNGLEGEELRKVLDLELRWMKAERKREMKEEKSRGKKQKSKHKENKTARKHNDAIIPMQKLDYQPKIEIKKGLMEKESDQYRNLFVNWLPPTMQMDKTANDDDQVWLLPKRRETTHHLTATNYFSRDIYALPFTVPF